MPAGTLIFLLPAPRAALDAAGQAGGIWFERNVGVTMPPTTSVARVPKIAVLVSTVPTGQSETSCTLDSIFSYDGTGKQQSIRRLVTSSDWDYVATHDSTSAKGLNNPSISDPLAELRRHLHHPDAPGPIRTDLLHGERASDRVLRPGRRLHQPERLVGRVPHRGSDSVGGGHPHAEQPASSTYGGIALVNNLGSNTSPITRSGAEPGHLFLPSNIYWYSAIPTGAVVDQRYPSNIATIGTANGFVAGLWNNRDAAANNGPVLIHGTTTAGSRYMFYNTNAFSRMDGQREWLYFVQAALWTNLTDEVSAERERHRAHGHWQLQCRRQPAGGLEHQRARHQRSVLDLGGELLQQLVRRQDRGLRPGERELLRQRDAERAHGQ